MSCITIKIAGLSPSLPLVNPSAPGDASSRKPSLPPQAVWATMSLFPADTRLGEDKTCSVWFSVTPGTSTEREEGRRRKEGNGAYKHETTKPTLTTTNRLQGCAGHRVANSQIQGPNPETQTPHCSYAEA